MSEELMDSTEQVERPDDILEEQDVLDLFADGFDNIEQPEADEEEQEETANVPQEEDEQEQPEQTLESQEQPVKAPTYTLNGETFSEQDVLGWKSASDTFTQRSQQLAEERKIVQPFAPLNAYLQQNPDKLKQVVELIQAKQEQPVEQPPEDPLEALKWEAKQEALAALREESKPLEAQQKAFQQQMQVQQTLHQVQADPLYKETHAKLDAYVKGDYAKIHGIEDAKALYRRLDSDPALYKNMYAKFRKEPEQAPAKRKAPVIDGGGYIAPTQQQAKKVTKGKDLNKLASKVYNNGTAEDLGNYLDKSGFLSDFLA